MAFNKDHEENSFAIRMAIVSSLMCLLVVFLATRLLVRMLNTQWEEWLLAPLMTIIPITFTFIILYYSAWHQQWSGPKRILLSALAACIIYGFDVFLLAMVAAIAALFTRFVSGH